MANRLFEKGREGLLDSTIDPTAGMSAALLDLSTAATSDAGIKQISSSTPATPIVITTTTAHGFTTGDIVYIDGHATNTAANGVWAITAASGSVFSLTHPISGANVASNGTGVATGYVVNMGLSASGDNYDDFDVALVGAKVALAGQTYAAGVFDANDTTFTSVSGNSVEAILIFRDTGTASSSRVVALITGKHLVTANTTLTAGTSLLVEPLAAAIPNGTVLAFSGGQSATLTALANAGDRVLTVSSTTVNIGTTALAPATGSGLPVTPNGGNIIVAWDNGVNKIFKV